MTEYPMASAITSDLKAFLNTINIPRNCDFFLPQKLFITSEQANF